MKKKLILGLALLGLCGFCITGCGDDKKEEKQEETKTVEKMDMSVEDIIDKVYEGIDDLPMLANIELDEENAEYYIGVKNVKFEEGIASEPMMGSTAHSIVVIKVKTDADIDQIKKDIKKEAEETLFRKWICVDAENVYVESNKNAIILIMTDEEKTDVADTVLKNFKNLK